LSCLTVIATASLCFILDWLTVDGAAIVCTGILMAVLLLSWRRFDHGRHPCFLFLCTLTLLQGGRLVTYCLGYLRHPMRAGFFSQYAFDLDRDQSGIVLLCVALSAICIYAPCRLGYQFFPPPSTFPGKKYLSYLYTVFLLTLPLQIFKTYAYYEYVKDHGGYVYFFLNHAAVASSVPVTVRAASLITLPVFVAIFVFESRRMLVYITTIAYFISSTFTLLLGSRAGLFALVLVLWYVAGLKMRKKTNIVAVALLAICLLLVGDVVQALRENSGGVAQYTFAPIKFVMIEGTSLEVTETAVQYRSVFTPYALHYLFNDLQNAFVSSDVTNYFRGKSLAFDVPLLLDRRSFNGGHGTGGSYLGEAYVLGGTASVVVISLLIGAGLHYLYRLSKNALSLVIVALILPDILLMPRGNLLDWFSALLKYIILCFGLALGWLLFTFFVWLKRAPRIDYTGSECA
jgi:oligosaccharide repeat unit polymerase